MAARGYESWWLGKSEVVEECCIYYHQVSASEGRYSGNCEVGRVQDGEGLYKVAREIRRGMTWDQHMQEAVAEWECVQAEGDD